MIPLDGLDIEGNIRLSIEADLHPDGTFGPEWLVVTDDTLYIISQNGFGPKIRDRIALSLVTEPKAENLVGGGMVEIAIDGRRVELIRYTTARVPRFAAAVQTLEKWLKGEHADIPEDDDRKCPKCGLPLEEGTKVCPACLPKSQTLRRLVRYLKPYWKRVLAMSLMSIAVTTIGLATSYVQTRPLVDRVLGPAAQGPLPGRLHLLAILVIAVLFLRVAGAVGTIAQGWVSSYLGNRVTHDIRCALYEHLQYLSLRFFDKRQMGTVVSRVNQDTGQLQQFLVWGSQDLALNALKLVGIGTMLFVLNWRLALVVIIPAPIVIGVGRIFFRRNRGRMHRFFHRWGRLNAMLNESLTGLKVIKAFAQERRVIDRFNRRSYELAVTGTQVERMWTTVFTVMSLFIMSGTILVTYIGGIDVIYGRMTLGTMMLFLVYVSQFYEPIQALSMLLNFASRAMTAAERVFEVLDTKPEVKEEQDAVAMPEIIGKVEFRDVTFGYDKHRPALKHVNFDASPGEMIGLVGHSGAGKSTTINLLCRFYDTDEGQILIDGIPISKFRHEDLRKQIGLVPQDTFMFSGTIADNIAYAKPGATKEEIVRAAMVANAHDFIRQKPDGYETIIGESGSGISAGERQRLAIARAVLHDPRILILDEATSSVDVETEGQIQQAMDRLVQGRTTFAIAHRLSTLKHADRLVVLKSGEIAEIGSHDQLMNKEEGEFKRLAKTYQEISSVRALER